MKRIFIRLGAILLILTLSNYLTAQIHLANGEIVLRGNRLISVKSENGKQLFHPGNTFFKRSIFLDAEMKEPEWNQALIVAPFLNGNGDLDKTTVRVLYDQANIYLFWDIDQPDGVTSLMKTKDSIITSDDYIQIDIKPWLPDSIIHGRDYSYSIAVNPEGVVWDSYFDPYLGGFYFSSWNSEARVSTKRQAKGWQVEMIIPYAGLDVASDPGWKWNLEFHHASFNNGTTNVSSPYIGITVQQDTMVRQPGLVAYYWSRPEFMPDVKQNIKNLEKKQASADPLKYAPKINGREDSRIWEGSKVLAINYTDKMGKLLDDNRSNAKVGIVGNTLCFNLKADGAKIRKDKSASVHSGSGMAGQMAGVNGVFVDQSLFQNESFWIILQPRNENADKIHQDYYLITINNRGEISGTHYDQYGVPFKNWTPKADIDLYNTQSGWGAEVNLSLGSFDISVDNSKTWGINIFRNRLINEKESELQAWESTANDFLNPSKLGIVWINFQQTGGLSIKCSTQNRANRIIAIKI